MLKEERGWILISALRTARFIFFCVCLGAHAGVTLSKDNGVTWQEFRSSVHGKRLVFRFPLDRDRTSFSFEAEPGIDRYTGAINIIGTQVGLKVGWRNVTSTYTLGLSLAPVSSQKIGAASNANELAATMAAYFEAIHQARIAAKLPTFTRVSGFDVVRHGERDWVRKRIEDLDNRSIWQDDYCSPWSPAYLLCFQIRYGRDIEGDSMTIAFVRLLGEEVLDSLRVYRE